ncbi:unnamed protein product [Rotaria sp. Silwood2]|nr:unnamed protein product [Rotaria sp. Silwood2]CAF2690724.1 unnamed protein product [Rotaria sp. Silwood2]CAF3158414.1 unnamed protein product [Rotaria sp. Silwood2]CAF3278705.1 unnamed protein product [Rotaria sp. Silwood2]CAF3925145.1 unnamed protein product [Rotaria sp. Silwood2]
MSTTPEPAYFNKSAYIALSCLIAFAVVITICVIKQFIWDPLLSKRFEVLRPVLSESVRKLSSSFYRPSSTNTSLLSTHQSFSDISIKTNDPPVLSRKNLITMTQSLPSDGIQDASKTNKLSGRSYGSSSSNTYAYTNYGSGPLDDEQTNIPTLFFSFQYNPPLKNIKLNIQNLRYMNKINNAINYNAYVLIRFFITPKIIDKSHETSPQRCQDCIRFGEAFIILSNIQPTDILNYEIKFSIILITDGNMYEIASAIYSMKDDYLTNVLFIERTLPLNFKLIESEMN